MKTRWALLSVYEKEGIVEFAKQLIALGFSILASGGTAKTLIAADVLVKDVSELVGGKAILGHRVVTLSREVHAGLLARYIDVDLKEMEALGLPYTDLVCVDLYPLQAEIDKPDSTPASVIEMTDIGGPTMIRSAAKGRRIVICDPADRTPVIDWLKNGEPDKETYLNNLAAKGEFVIAKYCLVSAMYHGQGEYDGAIGRSVGTGKAENGQQGKFNHYSTDSGDPLALENFKLIAGMETSYNNMCDLDRLLQTATHVAATFALSVGQVPKFAIGVKHGNACGAAWGQYRQDVIQKMVTGDSLALFGGLVMVNFTIDAKIAELLLTYGSEQRRLLDGIIAPEFSEDAIEMLRRKGDKCRFIVNPSLEHLKESSLDRSLRRRTVRGGYLRQTNYTFALDINHPGLVKYGLASIDQECDMLFAKAVGDTTNSNTITLVKNHQVIGNAVGQQARVRGCNLAVNLAGYSDHETEGAVAASDSFFPFYDGIEVLHHAGVKAILTTSGSVNDKLSIEYCQKNGIFLYMIPDSIGRGFFGH